MAIVEEDLRGKVTELKKEIGELKINADGKNKLNMKSSADRFYVLYDLHCLLDGLMFQGTLNIFLRLNHRVCKVKNNHTTNKKGCVAFQILTRVCKVKNYHTTKKTNKNKK